MAVESNKGVFPELLHKYLCYKLVVAALSATQICNGEQCARRKTAFWSYANSKVGILGAVTLPHQEVAKIYHNHNIRTTYIPNNVGWIIKRKS